MTQEIKSVLKKKILEAIVFVLIGVALLIWPDSFLTTVVKIIAIIFIAFFALSVMAMVLSGGAVIGDFATLFIGIILGVLGIVTLIKPEWVVSLQGIIFGAILIMHGIITITQTMSILRKFDSIWYLPLILSIITIVLGIVAMLNPFDTTTVLARIIGVMVIYSAIVSIWVSIKLIMRR